MRSKIMQKGLQKAEQYKDDMVSFLRDLIRIPGESCQEGEVIQRISLEMKKAGFDQVQVDPMGNILGRIGSGPRILAFDAHVDTVGIGDGSEWEHDPYEGKIENGIVYGRGAADQLGGMASMVYAGKIIKDLRLCENFSLYFVGSVQEEDCDGLCWQYIIEKGGLRPEAVVITEPTNLGIYRGQRGRIEIEITTEGISCHASAPQRGLNPIYTMVPIIKGIKELNKKLIADDFLGKATIAVTNIKCDTPSLCAVPNKTVIHLDRRLARGEDRSLALDQLSTVLKDAGVKAKIKVLEYRTPSYKGLVYPTEKYFPVWVLPEKHTILTGAIDTAQKLFGRKAEIGKWIFSTNGVTIMGKFGIPCFGFGPGNEVYAHSVRDQVPVDHLVEACAFYSFFPLSI